MNFKTIIVTILASIFVAAYVGAVAAADSGTAQALAGDIIELGGKRYCLAGIDAPEKAQTCTFKGGRTYDCGHISKTALMDLLAGATVRCTPTGEKRDGCVVANCAAGGFDLSTNMVHTGWALPRPGFEKRFATQQRTARKCRHGLYKGSFELPWEWRARHRRGK